MILSNYQYITKNGFLQKVATIFVSSRLLLPPLVSDLFIAEQEKKQTIVFQVFRHEPSNYFFTKEKNKNTTLTTKLQIS